MSANIFYYQVKPVKQKEVPTLAPSSFMNTLERVFGNKLPQLSRENIPKLEALRDAWDSWDSKEENPYKTLVDAVEKYEVIQLGAEY